MKKESVINGKALYSTKGAAREYGRVGCNFFTGCSNNCEYCYLKRGITAKALGGTEVRLKRCFKDGEDALKVFIRETARHKDYLRRTGVFFSFTTDPMLPETSMLTLQAALSAIALGIPVSILTKCASVPMSANLLINGIAPEMRGLVSFGFTLTGRDDMEPGADGNSDRIDAMRRLKMLGYRTFASIEPVIDWTHSRMAVDLSLGCCDHYKIGLRSGVGKDYYDVLQSGLELRGMVGRIHCKGRTVYLKESARKMLRRCFNDEECERILRMTVDADGSPYESNRQKGMTCTGNLRS